MVRDISDRPQNTLGLDFEENLEGFIQILNWLSVVSYVPVIPVMAGVLVGVLLRRIRLRVAGRIFATLVALNWMLVRWLEHRFLSLARK